jgi:glycerol-3-phosphate O-acyltransferase
MLDLGVLESRTGLLTRPAEATNRAAQLKLCADIVLPFLERYYLCVTLLLGQGPGVLTARELVKRCRAASEQLALVYTLASPDLFAAGLFENWIGYLEEAGLVADGADGKLAFDAASLAELAACLAFVLPTQIKASLTNLAGAAARPLSGESSRPSGAGDVRRSSPESAHSRAE